MMLNTSKSSTQFYIFCIKGVGLHPSYGHHLDIFGTGPCRFFKIAIFPSNFTEIVKLLHMMNLFNKSHCFLFIRKKLFSRIGGHNNPFINKWFYGKTKQLNKMIPLLLLFLKRGMHSITAEGK